MTIKYFLAPNARWQGRNLTGQPVIGGKLYTYINNTSTPKATYQDKDGMNANTNPVILDGKGEANIYWMNDDLYTIVLKTAQDQVVYSQDNYPYVDSDSGSTTPIASVTNLVRNPQFTWWTNTTNFSAVQNAVNQYDYICDDWIFYRSNTSATINLNRGTFSADEVTVPGTPIYFLHYECSSAGAGGETYRRASQYYSGVRSLAGQVVSVSFWAKSSTGSKLGVTLRQYFGSGGSTEVPNVVISPQTLTSSWAQYTESITLPSVSGKVIGTDSELVFDFDFEPNSVGNIDICNAQLQPGSEITTFPYQTVDDQFKKLDKTINQGTFATGDYKLTISSSPPPGWLLMDDKTIGNPNSNAANIGVLFKALFEKLWNEIGSDIYTPIYTSAGAPSTFGISAEADWNENKQLSITKALGRVLSGAGASITTRIFSAVDGSGNLQLNVTDVSSLFTSGTPFKVTSTGALPTGLTAGVTYYAVVTGSTSAIYIATDLAHAIAGTSLIPFTNSGSGTMTLTLDATTWTNGQYIGEQNHGLTIAEMPGHQHSWDGYTTRANGAEPGSAVVFASETPDQTGSTGLSDFHNNMQPTTFTNVMMKI